MPLPNQPSSAGPAGPSSSPLRPSWKSFTQDFERNLETVRELADLPSEILLLGHGSPVRSGGRDRLREVARR